MALVSVIVPTFNRAHMLERTLESIVAQTYEEIEIVVVDDGSTDDTTEVVSSLSRQVGRAVVYRKQENRGCAAARNKGLELATGDLIAFLDSDDTWLPTAAESMASTLVDSQAQFVYSPAIDVYQNGKEEVNYPVAAGRPEALAVAHFAYTNVKNGAFMFRREVLAGVPGLDETLRHNEDSDFVQRLAILYRGAYSSSPTVKCHYHESNKSTDRVAIYKSLLRSAENILSGYPEFARNLGEVGEKRLRQLKRAQVESLLISGNFAEALGAAASLGVALTPVMRIALLTRSARPMRVVWRWRQLRALPADRLGAARAKKYTAARTLTPSSGLP
jgi:glycosyltransferase involved in cell wall biosynthesis